MFFKTKVLDFGHCTTFHSCFMSVDMGCLLYHNYHPVSLTVFTFLNTPSTYSSFHPLFTLYLLLASLCVRYAPWVRLPTCSQLAHTSRARLHLVIMGGQCPRGCDGPGQAGESNEQNQCWWLDRHQGIF